jgi:hypothetical protein
MCRRDRAKQLPVLLTNDVRVLSADKRIHTAELIRCRERVMRRMLEPHIVRRAPAVTVLIADKLHRIRVKQQHSSQHQSEKAFGNSRRDKILGADLLR